MAFQQKRRGKSLAVRGSHWVNLPSESAWLPVTARPPRPPLQL